MDKIPDVWRLVTSLEGAQPLTVQDCTRILNVQWKDQDEKTNPYFVIRKGTPAGDMQELIPTLELRTPRKANRGGLLIMGIGPDVGMLEADVRKRFPDGRAEPASPSAPETQPDYYVALRRWGRLSFAVSRGSSKRVTSIVLKYVEPQT